MSKRSRRQLQSHIPLDGYIDDGIVVTKKNAVFALFRVEGVHPDTADTAVVIGWFRELHDTYLNIGDEDVELLFYDCRHRADPSACPPGVHRSAFTAKLASAYIESLQRNTLYSDPLFLGVIVHPPSATAAAMQSFGSAPTDVRAGIAARKERISEICARLQTQLHSYGLRRLGYVERMRFGILREFDEMAESIVFATTGVWREIGLGTDSMGESMYCEDIHFRHRHIELDGAGDPVYAAMFSFKYPARTTPGMLRPLSVTPYACTVVHSFRFLSNGHAESVVGRKQFKRRIGQDKAISQSAELVEAADEIASGRKKLGDHGCVKIVFAPDRKTLTDVANAAWRQLNSCTVHAVRLKGGLLKAGWLSMLPGNAFWRPRPGFVKASNMISFQPLYTVPTGDQESVWGEPVTILRTLAGTPLPYHWHTPEIPDNGNTVVTGASGSGKTATVGFLAAMTAGRARLVVCDFKQGWRFLAEEMGADYAVLGDGKASLAPLRSLERTPGNIEAQIQLWRGVIGGQITEEESRRLSMWFRTIWPKLPPALCCVGELRAVFDDSPEGAGVRLDKWIWGNELGWVLDAPRETIRFGDWTFFDMTAILDNPRARGPVLAYLFHRVSLLLTGDPLALIVDEGWRALIDDVFSSQIGKTDRTIRSKGGIVVFITQSPGDIPASPIARVLREQSLNQLHFNNPQALKADYISEFGFSDGQWAAFSSMPSKPGTFLWKRGRKATVVQAPLDGIPEYIPILSAPEKDIRKAEAEVVYLRDAAE